MKKEKIIILNKMYAGNYIEDGNLGHEVINLFKCDNGNNYIYLLSDGIIKDVYAGRVSCLLLVRQYKNNLLEILGKATGLTEIYSESKERADDDYQIKYIAENNISYGGVLLNEIFQGDDYQKICITYKADKVIKPKEPIYIQYAMGANSKLPILVDINRGQASHQFVYESNKEAYATLEGIIGDDSRWGEEVKTVEESKDEMKSVPPRTIFDICRTTYSELAYSNALGYYLQKDREFADKFVSEVLKIEDKLLDGYKVNLDRVHRIDILITDAKKAIIIENKVKSEINGVYTDKQKTKKDNQLERYYEKVRDDNNLQKKTIYTYLLAPDYNDIDISNLKYPYKKRWYSQLYAMMKSYSAYHSDPDFKILTDAIQRHISKYDNVLRDEMYRLFSERLSNVQKIKQI